MLMRSFESNLYVEREGTHKNRRRKQKLEASLESQNKTQKKNESV